MILLILLLKIQYEALCQAISVIGLVVKFSVATSAASGSPGFDSLITQAFFFCFHLHFVWYPIFQGFRDQKYRGRDIRWT